MTRQVANARVLNGSGGPGAARSVSRGSEAEREEATPILKLLHLSASPAVTPDDQEPSAPVVLSLVGTSGARRIQQTKTPGTGCGS